MMKKDNKSKSEEEEEKDEIAKKRFKQRSISKEIVEFGM